MNYIKSFGATLAVAVALITVAPLPAFAAGSANFTLSPSTTTVAQNDTFTVAIREDGSNVNVVTAKLAFDASQVQLLGFDATGSAFPNAMAETNGTTRYTNGGEVVNGSALVATAQFKALSSSGSTAVSIASGSLIASNGTNIWSGNPTATSVQLTAAAVQGGRGAGAPPAPATTPPSPASPTKSTTKTLNTKTSTGSVSMAPDTAVQAPAAMTPTTTAPKKSSATELVRNTANTNSTNTASTRTSPWLLLFAAVLLSIVGLLIRRNQTISSTVA